MIRSALAAVALLAVALGQTGCAKSGCIGKGDGPCRVEPPCSKLTFTCDGANAMALDVFQIQDGGVAAARPAGTNALATTGDYVLKNAFTTVVIAGVGNQNYLDPNGGTLLDLTTASGHDGVNQIVPVVGLLPSDASHITAIEIIDERPARVALQVRGTLDGRPDVPIYTRYELGPCDTGVRVRTEVLNATPDNQFWALCDGFYWSKREPIPFTPGKGQGFDHPSFGLTTVNDAYQTFPYLSFSLHNGEAASYSEVSCTDDLLEGFNGEQVSTAGLKRTLVPPRGWLAFERFLAVADARDVEGSARIALAVREQVLGEKHVKLTGKLERPMATALGTEVGGSILVAEGTMAQAPKDRTPWTQLLPEKDGSFTATVPAGRSYVISVHAFGRDVIDKPIDNVSADTDVGTLTLPSISTSSFEVTEAGAGNMVEAELYFVAADEATRTANEGTFHGQYSKCSPWLGAPPGPSPACNRVLVHQGVATAEIPDGRFHVYAFHGPFWSLGHQIITFPLPNADPVRFQLTRLQLQPPGTVTADLHVHGAASFDSSIPDFDRVLSFAASDLDVIVATDHDVAHDYAPIISQLGLQSRMTAVTGVETTGHIPWMRIPNYGYPLVIGHYNFWPIQYDPGKPRNGAPFDELIEPGTLFTRADDLMMPPGVGVMELNHPWATAEFGRDLGYPRALKLDLRKDLPPSDDGMDGRGMYVRKPAGARFTNDAHHAQEVMNGSQNDQLIQYRFFWFYMLNQGRVRTGTANSDSHSLTDNTVGVPRNVIYAGTQPGPSFKVDLFNAAIRNGRVLGTSAPIIEATVDGATGPKDFGLEPFKPMDGGRLHVKVTTAPWAPVPELRVIVNGRVVKTISNLPLPADPFGTMVHTAFDGTIDLSELLTGIPGDAWIVVEASRPLPVAEDLAGGLNADKDGMPDTTDNNGDGKIDKADVEAGSDYGPLTNLPFPAESDPLFHFANVTDNGFPYAFTNPFLLDRDGHPGFDAPGVNGGR